MTKETTNEADDAFDKIDALVAADKGTVNVEPDDVVIEEAAAPQTDDVEDGIEALRKQLESEKAARIEAERRAVDSATKARQAAAESEDSNLKLIDTAIANVKRERDTLKAQLKEAMTVGDIDAATDLQDKLTQNVVDLRQLEQGKHQFVNRPKAVDQVSNDPVEAFASRLTPESAKWVRAHPEFVTNAAKQREMFSAHEAAVGVNGLQADTPAYFKFVEDWLGVGKAPEKTVETREASPLSEAAATPPKRPTPPAAAPTSRNNAIGVTNPTTVTLTAEEREIAELNGMTAKEYAKNKLDLQKAGRMANGRNYN